MAVQLQGPLPYFEDCLRKLRVKVFFLLLLLNEIGQVALSVGHGEGLNQFHYLDASKHLKLRGVVHAFLDHGLDDPEGILSEREHFLIGHALLKHALSYQHYLGEVLE